LAEKNRDFFRVILKHHREEIEKAVTSFVDENFQHLDLHSHNVKKPNEAYAESVRFHRVIPYDTIEEIINFDVIAIVEISIYETSHSQALDGEVEKWIRISCEAELCDGLQNFRILGFEEYSHLENASNGLLSDTLVPYISRSQLENTAEAILKQYSPDTLSSPAPLNVRQFAKKIGLTVKEAHLSKGETIFGAMIFKDCTFDFFDLKEQRFIRSEVEEKTILVDPEVFFLRTLGSWNNTVVHECVHWIKHRKVFELERMFDEDIHMIRCQVTEKESTEKDRTDNDWMEFHANALAPRILMPRKPFKKKAAMIIESLKRNSHTNDMTEIMPMAIEDIADFFGVSKQAAKLRLIDVGYTEAIGAFEFVDDHYVPAHGFADGSITQKQTYTVPVVDSIIQYAIDPDLQRMLNSGDFVFIDNHYCINDPKYVTHNDYGILNMTAYALANMNECCLVFDHTTRLNAEYGVQRYTECVLYQKGVRKYVSDTKYSHNDHNKEVEARAAKLRAEQKEVVNASRILKGLPNTFNESLSILMKWRGISVQDLAEKSLLSTKTIQRLRNEHDYECSIETVMALCFGLQLHPSISDHLLANSGHAMKVGEKHVTYNHLRTTRYTCPIQEINEYLETVGYTPLSGKE